MLPTTRQCQGWVCFICRGPGSKYFQFCGPYGPCRNYSALLWWYESIHVCLQIFFKKKKVHMCALCIFRCRKWFGSMKTKLSLVIISGERCVYHFTLFAFIQVIICIHKSLFFNQRTVKGLRGVLSFLSSPIGNSFLLQVLEYLWPWETRQIYG